MPTYATNKKALFDYEVLEEFEAGIVLSGAEVKSVRSGQINLKGSFITFHQNSPILTNAHISPYKFARAEQYDPTHPRQILLKKKEISYLRGKTAEQGLTIVPLSVYTTRQRIKLKIALVRGKKSHDKRSSIKKRETEREVRRAMKVL